jgi:hypothetical protein
MWAEQFLMYLLVGGFALLQFLAGALKRRREAQLERQSGRPPEELDTGEQWWDPAPEPAPREVRVEATPSPAVLRPGAVERSAARAIALKAAKAANQPRRPARAEPAWSHHGIALRDRAELRRAVEMMAILGPPRSLATDDS